MTTLETALVTARALQFTSAMVLLGVPALGLGIAPEIRRDGVVGTEFDRWLGKTLVGSAIVAPAYLPGGVMNPDKLRTDPKAVAFVKAFFEAKKPVGAICHGPWTVIEAGAANGRTMTSWPSLKTDIQNAGGIWVDQEVVVDGNLVTSRNPKDIPAFNREISKLFATAKSRAAA